MGDKRVGSKCPPYGSIVSSLNKGSLKTLDSRLSGCLWTQVGIRCQFRLNVDCGDKAANGKTV